MIIIGADYHPSFQQIAWVEHGHERSLRNDLPALLGLEQLLFRPKEQLGAAIIRFW